ncbi:MAG: FlgD immunoglobulin-like domain containing protein [Candidatus Bathyarchaeia archaeon]
MLKKVLSVLFERLSRREYCSLILTLALGVSLSVADPISVDLHARWTPDLTIQNPQPQCVKGGTVAGGVEFHIVANFSLPGTGFGVDSIDIIEQTNVHEPQHYHSDGPISSTPYSSPPYSVCSSPPTGYQTWIVCQLNVPISTFAYHNTNYLVTANYHYMIMRPPPNPPTRVNGSLSITVNFQNLIVEAQPEYLVNNPGEGNHNTTITFQLSSAQKKYCTATISIYSSAGQLVKQETLNNLICPGTYTYQWDGKMTQGTPPLSKVAPKGIYPYDVEVVGACPYDGDYRCSKSLKITQTKAEIVGGLDDCSSWDGSSPIPPLQPKVSYVLEDTTGKSAYSAKITVFDRQIQNLGEESDGTVTNLPGTINPIWNEKILGIELVPEGFPYTFLVSAIDDHPETDKAHRRKTALQKNSRSNKFRWGVVVDEGHGAGDPGNGGSMYWDNIERRWKERYEWYEVDANRWIGNAICLWLDTHNYFNVKYLYQVKVVPQNQPSPEAEEAAALLAKRLKRRISPLLIQRARDVFLTEQEIRRECARSRWEAKGFVFLSVHCNSLGRPDINSVPNPTSTDNRVYYRFTERKDDILAEKITSALMSKMAPYWLYIDNRIGRTQPIRYVPSYNDIKWGEWMVLSKSSIKPIGEIGCRCPGLFSGSSNSDKL